MPSVINGIVIPLGRPLKCLNFEKTLKPWNKTIKVTANIYIGRFHRQSFFVFKFGCFLFLSLQILIVLVQPRSPVSINFFSKLFFSPEYCLNPSSFPFPRKKLI
ncbi:hypothetical protein CW304_31095 [Bacillus sp. UFRGS-B20]|nr:hypothetical protein CW304_31095 [Bacillus sp. UFRGS-B20]